MQFASVRSTQVSTIDVTKLFPVKNFGCTTLHGIECAPRRAVLNILCAISLFVLAASQIKQLSH